MTRVTAIAAEAFESEDRAREWLERCRSADEQRRSTVADALAVVNRAIQAHRIAAADPYVHEVSRREAARTRVGYGTGDELVGGRWRNAYDLPPERRDTGRRREMLAPQEEVAGVLGGKRPVWPSEDLALRARLDLDQGRPAQAALQLDAALTALEVEGEDAGAAVQGAIASILAGRATVGDALIAALRKELSEDDTAALADALAELERVMRRRRHGAAHSR